MLRILRKLYKKHVKQCKIRILNTKKLLLDFGLQLGLALGKGPKSLPKSTQFHPKSTPNPSQIDPSGVPGRVPRGGPPTVCPLIMIFPPFWRRRAAFGRPLGPRWARRGSPKRHFSGPISEKTGKNGVREPFREGHAILLKKRCETGPAGWVKTRIPVDTSLKI